MYGIIMSGMASTGVILTPIRLNTLGWSNFLAMLHSSINSSDFESKRSIFNKFNRYLIYIHYKAAI